VLGAARADLVALPGLVDELARTLTETHHDVSGYRAKIAGSPAPLSIPIVHLVDTRHKPCWHGEDPRLPTWVLTWGRDSATGQPIYQRLYATRDAAESALHRLRPLDRDTARTHRWDTTDRYGIAPTLETWVRVLVDELVEQNGPLAFPDLTERATVRSEAATLVEWWSFIAEQQWGAELAQDVTTMANQVRAALGEKPELELKCPQCNNPAYMQPGGILACTEVPDHDVVVRDLEQQLRRRPALATKDICEEFDLEPGTLRIWKRRRKIKPARTEQHGRTERNWWLPWDVFCLVNPDIADAIRLREEVAEGDREHA
jgi:hypothetical protein